jgi:hypothetical protein
MDVYELPALTVQLKQAGMQFIFPCVGEKLIMLRSDSLDAKYQGLGIAVLAGLLIFQAVIE